MFKFYKNYQCPSTSKIREDISSNDVELKLPKTTKETINEILVCSNPRKAPLPHKK